MDNDSASGHTLPVVDGQDTGMTQQQVPVISNPAPGSVAQVTPQSAAVAPAMPTAYATPVADDYPMTAEDVDLIEKAWVEKAKAIVRATHGNPYVQNKELHKIKAAYIQQRYNRDIKVSE